MKKQIPIIICLVMGIFTLIQPFIPHPIYASVFKGATRWVYVVGVFATVIGIGTLIRLHSKRIARRSPGWIYSIIVFVGFLLSASFGIIGGKKSEAFLWLFNNVNASLEAAMFSLLAFFMASAAYRAFRARTFEATLLLMAAIVVMLGRVPIGVFLWQHIFPQSLVQNSPFFPEDAAEWLMSKIAMASRRGIMIGAALGAISTSLKVILGIERSYLGGNE
jgi:hypothetical protein